ncbi:BRO1-domain-containing protein [Parathielavia hyrcaniae]|uniref:BRO1-domain-containing protein n=1 Tax=Parathielavia hyrcaniae TaxID=113614 RepID=A0AAN6T258_9PEZI|nr:BRO1-domain-containing protein [Parathielavia hyrcaniae]
MTTSNILSLPFRKSTQLSLASSIRQYISKKYDQHPDMFRHDLDVIDSMRRDAVNTRDAHPSGIKKLQAYAGQLVWMSGKFPLDIGVDFSWYPALGYHTEHPLVQNNLKYELMNILYNLAALYSQLAISSNRSSTEGLKTAASYFSQAAGVLKHMKTEVLPELRMANPPDDMDEATLESLTQLFLAQSQECFWQKAVMDGYKDASIAKLAARVSDLYNLAGEAAMRSEAISSAWIHHMSAKHHHFAAAAQYRAACECLERKRYGEEVARLADAVACVKEGLKECKGGYINQAVVDDLQGLKRRVEEDLKRAEKDNDVIYLQVVPPKSELRTLERANMAVARVPPQVANPYEYLGDHAEFGPALFTKLVPFSVHVAVSIYEERRDRIVNNNIVAELETLTDKLHEILSGLNLPGSLQALEKPLGLPGTLVQHADEIRQADAIHRLQRGLTDIEKLCASDKMIFEEGKALLAAEEQEDKNLRLKYGTQRWARSESRLEPSHDGGARLWNQAAEIDGYFASSTSSDAVVRDKFAAVKDTLAILAGSDRGIMDYIPNSRRTEIPELLKPAIGRLRGVYNDVLRLESRRRKRVESLRTRSRADDVKTDILAEAARLERTYPNTPIVPAHFEEFFDKRLDRLYEAELEVVEKERADQEKIGADLERANREFEAQKRSIGEKGSYEREKALQRLDNAYYKYKEIVSNVEVGRKFYNDLSRIVEQFRSQARNWVNERRKEARALEDELSMPPLSSLSLNPAQQQSPPPPAAQAYQNSSSPASYYTQQNQHPQSYPQPIRQNVQARPPLVEARIQSWADNVQQQQPRPMPPPVASLQGAWTPDMGIRFSSGSPAGGGGGGGGGGGSGGGNNGAQGGGGSKPAGRGMWDPNGGIRFG